MKRTFWLIPALLSFCACTCRAQDIIYEKEDSARVVRLLSEAPVCGETAGYMTYFGKKLKGTPYVAKTLETGADEQLVVNLRGMDCTTFTENALALSLCMKHGKRTFRDYADCLRRIRYDRGQVSYVSRQHYFTSWIDNNIRNGFVSEPQTDAAPDIYSATQRLDIDFMTQHASLYPQLAHDTATVNAIRKTEEQLTGRIVTYIPKSKLNDHTRLKRLIRSGDIIAIVTGKQGLDTSHIGIASWHKDGTLHLLNASQIHKKVIDEPMTLYQYMKKHPSQIGIRVIHVE